MNALLLTALLQLTSTQLASASASTQPTSASGSTGRGGSRGAPAATPSARLGMEEAVRIALERNPDMTIPEAQIDIASAQATQARAALLPSLGLSGRYTFALPRRSSALGDLGASASASALLWDFGRTGDRWRSREASVDAAREGLTDARRALALQVRLAYVDALEARSLTEVAVETLANARTHLAQTKRRVELGSLSEVDLARVRTRVADSTASLIAAQNAERLAHARLDRAMGLERPGEYTLAPTSPSALPEESEPLERLERLALEARPDIAAQRDAIRAQALSAAAADRSLWPSLRANASAAYAGYVGYAGHAGEVAVTDGLSAVAGITLSWTLFDGLASPAAGDAERASLRIAQARLESLEQTVHLEVREALMTLQSAQAQLEATAEGVQAAGELLRLAEARYAEGLGDSIELSDAQLERTQARIRDVRAQNDLLAARVQLIRALGLEGWGD